MQTLLRWQFGLGASLTQPIYSLRNYQQKALGETIAAHTAGKNRVFVCAPTGSGKGTMIGALAQNALLQCQTVAILLNMSPLVGQTIEDLQDFGLDGNISVLSGSHDQSWFNPELPVQVAMLQTIANRPEELNYLAQANLALFDEFHTTKNYQDSIQFLCGRTKVASFSATPYNSALGDVADEAVICPSYLELQALGFLAPLKYTTLELDKSGKRDLNSDEGVRYVLNHFLATEGVRLEGASRSLWFCEMNRSGSESHCKRLQRIARDEFGLNLVVVDESMSTAERDRALVACHDQSIDGLICVDALAVGVDIKSLRHVCLCRRIGSRDRYVQIVGRVSRMSPETGKTFGYVNDFGGNLLVGRNGGLHPFIEQLSAQVTRESILGLPSETADGEAPCKWCNSCGMPSVISAIECDVCGAMFPSRALVDLSGGILRSGTVEEWWEIPDREPQKTAAWWE
jgi:DNA repair protein RadD